MIPIIARCGYRCDLCLAYRENIRGPADQQRISDGWFKYYGFRIPPEQICCNGCLDERPEARRIDSSCPIRPCALARAAATCAQCPDYGCARLDSRTVTRQWVEQRFGAAIPARDYRRLSCRMKAARGSTGCATPPARPPERPGHPSSPIQFRFLP